MTAHRLRRHPYARAALIPIGILTVSTILTASCSENDPYILAYESADASAPQIFERPDAATDRVEMALINYCPSNKCPAGHATCPNSFFPCDIDLNTDPRNCGACGAACPRDSSREVFSCVEGQCVMTCTINGLDCDGLVDTGCEVSAASIENCGSCGNACDIDNQEYCFDFKCGCPDGKKACAGICISTQTADEHCGACGNGCDPAGDGGGAPPHMYFGCASSTCGHLKCEPGWANCDGLEENGCERQVGTDTDCVACDDNCLAKGETCLRTPFPHLQPFCGCPAGQTFCGTCQPPVITVPGDGDGGLVFSPPPVCIGQCVDLRSDAKNCGACGLACNGSCEFGSCLQHCPYGRADCDGNPDCEVNTLSDPQNCGGCGIVCDAIEGQACVRGQCVVEPCDQGDGGFAR